MTLHEALAARVVTWKQAGYPLGLGHPDLLSMALDLGGVDALIEAVRRDDDLVKTYKLEAIRETLTLDYPSYILGDPDIPVLVTKTV